MGKLLLLFLSSWFREGECLWCPLTLLEVKVTRCLVKLTLREMFPLRLSLTLTLLCTHSTQETVPRNWSDEVNEVELDL